MLVYLFEHNTTITVYVPLANTQSSNEAMNDETLYKERIQMLRDVFLAKREINLDHKLLLNHTVAGFKDGIYNFNYKEMRCCVRFLGDGMATLDLIESKPDNLMGKALRTPEEDFNDMQKRALDHIPVKPFKIPRIDTESVNMLQNFEIPAKFQDVIQRSKEGILKLMQDPHILERKDHEIAALRKHISDCHNKTFTESRIAGFKERCETLKKEKEVLQNQYDTLKDLNLELLKKVQTLEQGYAGSTTVSSSIASGAASNVSSSTTSCAGSKRMAEETDAGNTEQRKKTRVSTTVKIKQASSKIGVHCGSQERKWFQKCTGSEKESAQLTKGDCICIDMESGNDVSPSPDRKFWAAVVLLVQKNDTLKIQFEDKSKIDEFDLKDKCFFVFKKQELSSVKTWIQTMS